MTKKDNKEGWSDSIITYKNPIHYYKNGVSLCGKAVIDNGHKNFDKSKKYLNDKFCGYCVLCIKKLIEL